MVSLDVSAEQQGCFSEMSSVNIECLASWENIPTSKLENNNCGWWYRWCNYVSSYNLFLVERHWSLFACFVIERIWTYILLPSANCMCYHVWKKFVQVKQTFDQHLFCEQNSYAQMWLLSWPWSCLVSLPTFVFRWVAFNQYEKCMRQCDYVYSAGWPSVHLALLKTLNLDLRTKCSTSLVFFFFLSFFQISFGYTHC